MTLHRRLDRSSVVSCLVFSLLLAAGCKDSAGNSPITGSGGSAGIGTGGASPVGGQTGEQGGMGGNTAGTGGGGAGGTAGGGPACGGAGGTDATGSPWPPMEMPVLAPVESTTCSVPTPSPADECGCGGLSCAAGLHCIRVLQPAPNAFGGPDQRLNRCFETCAVSADCGAGRACLQNLYGLLVCVTPACRSDADCGACEHCLPRVEVFHGGATYIDRSSPSCRR